MHKLTLLAVACALLAGLVTGCATTRGEDALVLKQAENVAWSLRPTEDEMIVAVSPARQTLQIAGSAGTLIGSTISAVSNARHREAIEKALEGYEPGAIFENHLTQRLHNVLGQDIERVPALTTYAGYPNKRAAEDARYQGLGNQDYGVLLDLKMTYGLFGFEGTLITKLEGEVNELPGGHVVWRRILVASSEEVLASDRLTDPTNIMKPNFTSPRLTVEEGAIEQWTANGGELLRARFEQAVEGVASALFTEMGLVDEALGHYYLGRHAMNDKDFDKAAAHYRKALELDPALFRAKNGLSVNLAHHGNLDQAIAMAKELTEARPDYGPAYYNLAWWYAVEKDAPEAARPCYTKALELGMPEEKKIEKVLAEK